MGAFTRSYIFFFRTEQGRVFCTGKGKNNFHFQISPFFSFPLPIVLGLLGTTRVKRQRKRYINTHDIYLRRASSAQRSSSFFIKSDRSVVFRGEKKGG